eukprot:9817146-Alexandrium_andersonii.AAC.1
MPWDWVEVAIEGLGIPGLGAYLARDPRSRELTPEERAEWNACVTSGMVYWDGVRAFIRKRRADLESPFDLDDVVEEIRRRNDA